MLIHWLRIEVKRILRKNIIFNNKYTDIQILYALNIDIGYISRLFNKEEIPDIINRYYYYYIIKHIYIV